MTGLQRQSEQTARDLLASEGYFSPQVDSAVERVGDDWRVDYRVVPGPRSQVRSVKLAFEGALKTREAAAGFRGRIERGFSLKQGMPFRQSDWAAAKLAVLQPLLTGRYPAARIAASEARIDPATRSADLSLTLDSGPAFFYGQPVISGSQRYPETIALHLNPTQSGKPVRQQDLFDYQTALEASGYYAQAVVSIEPDPALGTAAVPIRVELVERPEKLFSVGAGYSTDTGLRVQTAWQHRDILDQGLRLKLEVLLETKEGAGLAELSWPRGSNAQENCFIINSRLQGHNVTAHGAKIINARLEEKVFVGFNSFVRGMADAALSVGRASIIMPHTIIDLEEPVSIPPEHLVWGYISKASDLKEHSLPIRTLAKTSGRLSIGNMEFQGSGSRFASALQNRIEHILEANGAYFDGRRKKGHAQKDQSIAYNIIQPYPIGVEKGIYPTLEIQP